MATETTEKGVRPRTAAALRTLGNLLVDHAADDALLAQIAAAADQFSAAVAESPVIRRSVEDVLRDNGPLPADGARMDHYPGCPVSGQENPMGLAIELRREGDSVAAIVLFDAACAGLPGVSHGGPVAAVFDDVMGFVLSSLNRLMGYTATLTVSYLAPVPLKTEIEFRGRLARRDGRKLFIEATAAIAGSGPLLAEAEGLFIEAAINGQS